MHFFFQIESVKHKHLKISRYPLEIGRYTMADHKKDKPSPNRYLTDMRFSYTKTLFILHNPLITWHPYCVPRKKMKAKSVLTVPGTHYSMRIEFSTNRTFCEPNQRFDRAYAGLACADPIIFPGTMSLHKWVVTPTESFLFRTDSTDRGPIELLVRYAKSSDREKFDAQTRLLPLVLESLCLLNYSAILIKLNCSFFI